MPDPRTLSSGPTLPRKYRLRRALLRLAGLLLNPPPALRIPHPAPTTHGPLRILLIRPDHLGDVLLTTPAFARLRQVQPEARLTALVGPWAEAVARRNPHLDEVLTLPFPGFTRQPAVSLVAPYRQVWQAARWLRQYRFDAAIVLRVDHWWGGLLAALAGIPQRVGYAAPDVAPFLTHALPYQPLEHVTRQSLVLVEEVGRLGRLGSAPGEWEPGQPPTEFPLRDEERAAAQAWLRARGVGNNERLVAVHPGAGAAVKLWTAAGWAQVADALAGERRVVLTGSAAEAPLTAEVARLMRRPALDAAGATDLPLLAALLARCDLALGPDAGALHLATAVGTPTVRLYGPVNPRQFGPWGDPQFHRVVVVDPPLACQFCERLDYPASELPLHPCVRWIQPSAVLAAAHAVLFQTTTSAR